MSTSILTIVGGDRCQCLCYRGCDGDLVFSFYFWEQCFVSCFKTQLLSFLSRLCSKKNICILNKIQSLNIFLLFKDIYI
jgi:hypothetical protein